jgi:hypothetical protein
MPVIFVLAPSSLSGTPVCPCGLHANLFDHWVTERTRTRENSFGADRYWIGVSRLFPASLFVTMMVA